MKEYLLELNILLVIPHLPVPHEAAGMRDPVHLPIIWIPPAKAGRMTKGNHKHHEQPKLQKTKRPHPRHHSGCRNSASANAWLYE